ncbi:MAG: tyrosine--tRNA ligase [Pseudomonadota bacterium]
MNNILNNELFTRVIDQAFSFEELKIRLTEERPLRIKYGVDVTAPFLHIGHAVNLWCMRQMQDLGHKVVFLIGDFTTRIGDPTGKSKTRPVIPLEEIEQNAKHFIEQVSTILRTESAVFEIRRNSEWYGDMGLDFFLGLLSQVTHGRLIQRDMFQARIKSENEIYVHELLYPVLQGYDSVMLESDLTIVGSDQLFNEMMGRLYQEKKNLRPQIILTTRITMGTDGKNKQSKSLNNYIALADSPKDKFGKLMSLPDSQIRDYLEVYSTRSAEEIKALLDSVATEPMKVKMEMAKAVVERYHGGDVAELEQTKFTSVFSKRQVPMEMPEVIIPSGVSVIDAVCKADASVGSRSRARRLIRGNGVRLNDATVTDEKMILEDSGQEVILNIGKLKWFKLLFNVQSEQ